MQKGIQRNQTEQAFSSGQSGVGKGGAETILMPLRAIRKLQAKSLPLRSIPRQREIPLSFAQQRIWVFSQLNPNIPIFNTVKAYRVTGPLNIIALEKSINEIIRRHEVLRTTFPDYKGYPIQVIARYLTLTLQAKNLQNLSANQREDDIIKLCNEMILRPIELIKGPILRVDLLQTGPEEHILMFVSHQIIFDGGSWSIFNKELSLLYEAFCLNESSPLKKLPLQYIDFVIWQKELLKGEVLDTLVSYWKRQFVGEFPMLNIPIQLPPPAKQTNRGETLSFFLDKSLTEGLKVLSRKEGVTLFTTLLAAFKTLLYRYTLQDDILVFTSVPGRNRAEVRNMIGLFSNFLPLRVDFAGNPSFRELLSRVGNVFLGAFSHQDLPFEYMLREIQTDQKFSKTSLFQVLFIFQNAAKMPLVLSNLKLTPMQLKTGVAKFDLSLFIEETEHGQSGMFTYKTDLFNHTMITRMFEHFRSLLDGIVHSPDQCILDLPCLKESERKQLMAGQTEALGDVCKKNDQIQSTTYRKRLDLKETFKTPENQLESLVASVWEKVLRIDRISIHDNFFDLGGNSLFLVKLTGKLRELLNRDLSIIDIFRYPTIRSLTKHLQGKKTDKPSYTDIRNRVKKRQEAFRLRKRQIWIRNNKQ